MGIEKFIARLQHAAAAFRELEKRRRSRKSKKKDLGDGMLSMRAKPPPEREFEDIFQKFKLSFNLLAKVLAPLLTKSAVDLLINCLTSKESELWHSLGEPWYVPREQWKGYVPPYKPVFMDGWSPAMYDEFPGSSNGRKYPGEGDDSTINDEDEGVMRAGYTNNYGYGATEGAPPTDSENERGNTPNHYPGPANKAVPQRVLREERRSPSEQDFGMNNNRQQQHSPNSESAESEVERTGEQQIRFERQQRNFMMDLLNKSAKVVQVTYPRTANNEKELSVSRGEYLEVIDDTRKWWRARNLEGQVGHVPHTIVTPSQGLTDSPQVSPKSAEWIQKERRGKKGEFRYF